MKIAVEISVSNASILGGVYFFPIFSATTLIFFCMDVFATLDPGVGNITW